MTKSMTGYGQASGDFLGQALTVEIRTLNGRFREVAVRLPLNLSALEDPIKKIVAEKIHRGRVEVRVQSIGQPGSFSGLSFDSARAEAALNLLRKLKDETGAEGPITLDHLLALNVLADSSDRGPSQDLNLIQPKIESLTSAALGQLLEFRAREGAATEKDLLDRLAVMERILGRIRNMAQEVNDIIYQKIRTRIEELLQKIVDHDRLAQEAAFLAEKMDITEEIVRFDTHLAGFRQILADPGPIGRRLEFSLQELSREANTMGSKSQWGPLTEEVLALKSELEKAREQAQNVE
jgi:uncharacterized protein (TIGR00255 family)